MAKEKKKEAVKEVNAPKFAKKDILASEDFTNIEKDFLKAFLDDGKYTLKEAKKVLMNKRKGVVK